MQDIGTQLTQLKRPKLLVRAARLGVEDYQRRVHLPRILRSGVPEKTGAIFVRLLDLENHHNALRKTRDASYSAARHVDVLIALMAEAQLSA